MVVRLLVVVLTVFGAIPVRVCTCGAAHHHHHHAPPPRDTDRQPPPAQPAVAADPGPAEHHDADCHAVKPRPLMSVGLQFDLADVPPADAAAVALVGPPPADVRAGHTIRETRPPPDRPLFLTLGVLRI
jgi:hypothetical protein